MIADIELLLKEIEGLRGKELKNKRNEYIRKLVQMCELSNSNYSSQVLFAPTNSPQKKKFISACLLRLLGHNENAVWEDHDFRLKTFILFDEQITDVYYSLQIEASQDNHVKLSHLKALEQETLNFFESMTLGISSLKTAVDLQSKLMKALKDPSTRIFLDSFVDNHLTLDERIRELFTCLRNYNQAFGVSRMNVYQEVDNVFSAYIKDAENSCSIFAKVCLVNTFKKFHNLIKEDFGKSDIIKPTKLRLFHPNRKYPFHKIGEHIEFKFILENEGLGHAFDVQIEIIDADKLQLEFEQIEYEEIKVEKLSIVLRATVLSDIARKPSLFIRWSWQNYDKSQISEEEIFEFESQKEDINWDKLKLKRPYSLQAVEKEEDLIGRGEQVQNIYTNLIADTIESVMIFGQKRVGKTSIAKTLANKLEKEENLIPIYIKVGDLDKTTSSHCVRTLADAIVEEIQYHNKLSNFDIPKPVFTDVLSPPLANYFRRVKRIYPNIKFIIIIDEFDEIPSELCRYSNIGNTFFHNIRSLSQEGSQIGFILVGGENMQIIRQSTDRLNLFSPFQVDYFDKERFFGDFQELIRYPVQNILEFSDESINKIYELTEGNPFFTKFICDKLFKQACDRKDSYISIDETSEAIRDSIESLDTINVNHFWIDGIWEDKTEKLDKIQTQRRKFLIAYAEIKRCKGRVKKQDILEYKLLNDVAIESLTEGFINRGILLEEDGCFRLKPRIFEEWLVQKGSRLLTSSFSDANAIEELRSEEEKVYVTDKEIAGLIKNWGLYKNSEITIPYVRIWLEQFEDNFERRIMFKLLQNITFYSEKQIREKLTVIHSFVRRNMLFSIKEGEKSIREILLSSFGHPAKSGSSLARMYAAENKVISTNVALLNDIPKTLEKNERISTLVFIDDIIASGGSIIEGLKNLSNNCGEAISAKNLKVVVATVCGLESGKKAIEKEAIQLPFNVEVYICDPLNDSNRCFTEESLFFENDLERTKAKEIALKYGTKLQKKQPLGYDGGQLVVVFPDTCPNNSLPILWCSSDHSWVPLFRRY